MMKLTVRAMINECSKELKALKGEYRDPAKQPPKRAVCHRIIELKLQVTVLCSFMAQQRCRIHCRHFTAEQQAEFIAKHYHKYLEDRPERAAAV